MFASMTFRFLWNRSHLAQGSRPQVCLLHTLHIPTMGLLKGDWCTSIRELRRICKSWRNLIYLWMAPFCWHETFGVSLPWSVKFSSFWLHMQLVYNSGWLMRDAISAIVQRLHVAVTFYSVLALVLVFVVRQNFHSIKCWFYFQMLRSKIPCYCEILHLLKCISFKFSTF